MRIGTAEPNSTFLSQGLALKAVLLSHGVSEPIQILTSEKASIQNGIRLGSGDIDFGYMAANWVDRARRGDRPFEHPIDLRMVSPMNAGPSFFVTLANSDIRSVGDLRGKRVSVGPEMSGIVQHASSIFGALKISFDDFNPIYLDFASGADALARGEIDAQLQCPIPNAVMTALDNRANIRVIPYAPADLETVLRECPIYHRTIMRKGVLRGLVDDVAQPATVNVLVAHARADTEMVRKVASICYTGSQDLEKLDALYTGMPELFLPLKAQGATAFEFGGAKLHPGAIAAYKDAGLI